MIVFVLSVKVFSADRTYVTAHFRPGFGIVQSRSYFCVDDGYYLFVCFSDIAEFSSKFAQCRETLLATCFTKFVG